MALHYAEKMKAEVLAPQQALLPLGPQSLQTIIDPRPILKRCTTPQQTMCLRDTASLDPYGRVAWRSRTECLKVTRGPADHSTAKPRHDGVIRIRVSGQIVKNSTWTVWKGASSSINGSRDDQVLMYVDPPAKWQRRTDDYPPTTWTNSAPSHSTPARAAASTAQRTSTGSSQAQAQPHPPQHIRFRWALIHFGIDRVAAIRAAKAAIQSGQRLEQQQKKAQVVGSHSLPARPVSVQVTRQTAGGGGGDNNTCSGGAGGGGM
ncbi:hypothetical protein BGW80DRAFT_1248709 [Lactifluus volemus]|nr:hypothetical protein BGW80DRAFT_1248709 [Lactifluus volemus]